MTYRLMKWQDDEDIPPISLMYKIPSISQFISIAEENYWQYVTTTDNVYFYKVFEKDVIVATTHCEIIECVLYMDIVVFPEYQRKGVASRILKDIQEGNLGLDFDKIQVSIDEKTVHRLNCLKMRGLSV